MHLLCLGSLLIGIPKINVCLFQIFVSHLVYPTISNLPVIFKPGSQMPLNYLRHSCQYCLGYCSDMPTYSASNNNHRRALLWQACEVGLSSTFQARKSVRAWNGCCCQQCMFSNDGTVSQAVPAAMWLVVRRHMRTRL